MLNNVFFFFFSPEALSYQDAEEQQTERQKEWSKNKKFAEMGKQENKEGRGS